MKIYVYKNEAFLILNPWLDILYNKFDIRKQFNFSILHSETQIQPSSIIFRKVCQQNFIDIAHHHYCSFYQIKIYFDK